MASPRKTRREVAAKVQAESICHCRDCANSYDWQSEALDGHLILGKCPHKKNGGKYCIFLSDPACELFQKRNA